MNVYRALRRLFFREDTLSAQDAFLRARDLRATGGKHADCSALELAIATGPVYSWRYAFEVLKGPFLAGEKAVAGTSWQPAYLELLVAKPEL